MKYLSFILILIFTGNLHAQSATNKEQQRFEAGIVAGFNATQVDGDDLYGYEKLGLNAGVMVSAVLAKRWRANVEMVYSMLGSNGKNDDSGDQLYMAFNYISVPVYASFLDWEVTDKDNVSYMRIKASVGGQFSYMINGTREFNGVTDPHFDEEYKKTDISAIIGASIFFTRHWGLDFRYQYSIPPFTQTYQTTKSQYHNVLTLRGIYKF